jgi:hypothetical protein
MSLIGFSGNDWASAAPAMANASMPIASMAARANRAQVILPFPFVDGNQKNSSTAPMLRIRQKPAHLTTKAC